MRRKRRKASAPVGAARRAAIATMLAGMLAAAVAAPPAGAASGYELATPVSSLSLGTGFPHGLAVDQANRRLYVAVVTTEPLTGVPGHIARFESNGTAAGTFAGAADLFYGGVAVNPVTQGFYGAAAVVQGLQGPLGTARMDTFSSAGVLGTPFSLSEAGGALPQIATDSSGDVYFPNPTTDTVQVFDSAGSLQEQIACTGCPGGAFGRPVSVAMSASNELYVVDLAPDRVLKFTLSEGSYQYASTLQSGLGAAAVAVDPTSGDVLVGDMPNGRDYHIVAYTSAGAPFDDFGAGLFLDPAPHLGATVAPQIAIDGTSRRLYVGETDKIYLFDRVTITPPTATTVAASTVGQVVATLNATVNAKGHAVLECDFEYVADGAFQSGGFDDATVKPCSKLPNGSSNVAVSAAASGLMPSTTYHYRVTATSHAGSVTASKQVFTALPVVPPTVTTDPASGLTETTATLVGRVNPHGGTVTSCRFEYGATASYGSTSACKTAVGPVTTNVTQQLGLTGLSSDTTYHYRLVVTTNAGTTHGDDVAFSTAGPPPPPPPPPPPDPPPPPPLPPVLDPPPPSAPPLTCRKGFVKRKIAGKYRCVRKCRKGQVRKTVRGKVKCVTRKPRRRSTRQQPVRADRR